MLSHDNGTNSRRADYMVKGLVPSYEVISFQQVGDEAEAQKMLNARKKRFGESGKLTTVSDRCYKVSNSWSYRNPFPPGTDEEQYLRDQLNSTNAVVRTGVKVVEESGHKITEHTSTYTTCFRVHDNVLYESSIEQLFEMSLPTAESLIRGVDGANDVDLDLFFDRIPMGIKHQRWNMLNSGVGAQL